MVTIFGVQLDWGKFPDWITAVVAGASAMVAAFTYRSSVRDKQRAQAYQVAAWVALDEQGKNRVESARESWRLLPLRGWSNAKKIPLSARGA